MQGGNLLPNVKTNLQPWFLLNQKSVSVGGFPLMNSFDKIVSFRVDKEKKAWLQTETEHLKLIDWHLF